MNLKDFLKKLKTAESSISTFFGIVVVLVVGVLILKYFQGPKQEFFPESQPEPAVSSAELPVVPENLPETHKVLAGETLWSIAEKYFNSGYNWVDIAKENKLQNPNILFVGSEIAIPQVPRRMPVSEINQGLTPITEEKYTIVRGDSLWEIALRAYGDGYRWVEIAEYNKLANPNIIHSGNVLSIPR